MHHTKKIKSYRGIQKDIRIDWSPAGWKIQNLFPNSELQYMRAKTSCADSKTCWWGCSNCVKKTQKCCHFQSQSGVSQKKKDMTSYFRLWDRKREQDYQNKPGRLIGKTAKLLWSELQSHSVMLWFWFESIGKTILVWLLSITGSIHTGPIQSTFNSFAQNVRFVWGDVNAQSMMRTKSRKRSVAKGVLV